MQLYRDYRFNISHAIHALIAFAEKSSAHQMKPTVSIYGGLEVSVARDSWKRDHVTDVFEPGDEHDEALEAQAKARMGHGTVAAQISVPPDVRRLEAALDAALLEDLQIVLTGGITSGSCATHGTSTRRGQIRW